MLMNLEGAAEPEGFDEEKDVDIQISSKMSKSKPQSSIFVHDTTDEIREKIMAAYCPAKIVEGNPLLDYANHIVFRGFESITVERKPKFGGDIDYASYKNLEKAYVSGDLHPLDLKTTMVTYLDRMVDPIRTHFEKKKSAREMLELVMSYQITR